jgi:hypothetical protein
LPDFVVVVLSPAALSVEPPVAWANERLAPNSSVNAIVSSFFIGLLQRDIGFFAGNCELCKDCCANILSREAGKKKAAFYKTAFVKRNLLEVISVAGWSQ